VKIDTLGPVCAAKNVTVKHHRTCRLYFKVHDTRSSEVTNVLAITTKSVTSRKHWSWGYGENYAGWWWISYACRLPRGTYYIASMARISPATTERGRQGAPACDLRQARSRIRGGEHEELVFWRSARLPDPAACGRPGVSRAASRARLRGRGRFSFAFGGPGGAAGEPQSHGRVSMIER